VARFSLRHNAYSLLAFTWWQHHLDATLVNTHTHTHTDKQTDGFSPVILLPQPAKLKNVILE